MFVAADEHKNKFVYCSWIAKSFWHLTNCGLLSFKQSIGRKPPKSFWSTKAPKLIETWIHSANPPHAAKCKELRPLFVQLRRRAARSCNDPQLMDESKIRKSPELPLNAAICTAVSPDSSNTFGLAPNDTKHAQLQCEMMIQQYAALFDPTHS